MSVESALRSLTADSAELEEPELGNGPRVGDLRRSRIDRFVQQMEASRRHAQLVFWICAAAIAAQFIVLLMFAAGVLASGSGVITAAIGGTATTTLILLLRFAREGSRARFVSTIAEELRQKDPDRFLVLAELLLRKWYGLK